MTDDNDLSDYERYLRQEAEDAFIYSTEARDLLAEIFRNLRNAKALISIEPWFEGYDTVLGALTKAQFPRKLVILRMYPRNMAVDPGYQALVENLALYSPHIKGLLLLEVEQGPPRESGANIKEILKENKEGFHIKNFRSSDSNPGFSQLVSASRGMEELCLFGCCGAAPCLRICHGCEDLFVTNFAKTLHPHLSTLLLCSIYISGSQLRRFLKLHDATLQHIEIYSVTLTDMSWKFVARGLMKMSSLQVLEIDGRIYQKGAEAHPVRRPTTYVALRQETYCYWKVQGQENLRHFLGEFIKYFQTHPPVRLNMPHVRRTAPNYYEPVLFSIPGVTTSMLGSEDASSTSS